MKKFSLRDIKLNEETSILSAFSLEGYRVVKGGVHVYTPGEISHKGEYHVHDHPEVFIGIEGRAKFLIDGTEYEFKGGDVFVIEPGEEHHVTACEEDPITLVWLDVKKLKATE